MENPRRQPLKRQTPSSAKSRSSQGKPAKPDSRSVRSLLQNVEKYRSDRPRPVPEKAVAEEESWLDWGLRMAKQYGPKLLELAPELLALL